MWSSTNLTRSLNIGVIALQGSFVRECDDFVILVKSQRAGDRVMHSITQFIERKLKLKINSRKSSL